MSSMEQIIFILSFGNLVFILHLQHSFSSDDKLSSEKKIYLDFIKFKVEKVYLRVQVVPSMLTFLNNWIKYCLIKWKLN